MEPLNQMAILAAREHLRGRSSKRNSLLKPLDIILENIESEPREEFRDLVRKASERNIFDHIDSVTEAKYRLGYVKREKKQDVIRDYVNLFFDEILIKMHKNDVNRLLRQGKMLRSAYLIYYREALSSEERVQHDEEQLEEVKQQSLEHGE